MHAYVHRAIRTERRSIVVCLEPTVILRYDSRNNARYARVSDARIRGLSRYRASIVFRAVASRERTWTRVLLHGVARRRCPSRR